MTLANVQSIARAFGSSGQADQTGRAGVRGPAPQRCLVTSISVPCVQRDGVNVLFRISVRHAEWNANSGDAAWRRIGDAPSTVNVRSGTPCFSDDGGVLFEPAVERCNFIPDFGTVTGQTFPVDANQAD